MDSQLFCESVYRKGDSMNEANIEIGKRIFEKRKEKGLSQAELAEKMGVHSNTISNWECKGRVPIKTLSKLAHVLECSEQYLLYGNEKKISFEEAETIEEIIILLSQILCISKEAAMCLYDSCIWSMEDMSYFFMHCNVGEFAEKTNEYMYCCALENDSTVLNKNLLEMKKNDIIATLIKQISKAAALCDKKIINRYKNSEVSCFLNDTFYMPNIGVGIDRLMQDLKIYELLEHKQRELIIEYLVSVGGDKELLVKMNKVQLIGEYRLKMERNDHITNDLLKYANELYDEKITPVLRAYLSEEVIENFKERFLDDIGSTTIRFKFDLSTF